MRLNRRKKRRDDMSKWAVKRRQTKNKRQEARNKRGENKWETEGMFRYIETEKSGERRKQQRKNQER